MSHVRFASCGGAAGSCFSVSHFFFFPQHAHFDLPQRLLKVTYAIIWQGKKGQRDACRAVAGLTLTLTLTLGTATKGDLEASVQTNTSALISVAERPHQLSGCRCSQSLWMNHRKPAEYKLSLKFKSFCGT